MALALGEMIPAEIHHVPSQECDLGNLERVCRTCQYVPAMGKRVHLVIVDEADQMTAAAQLFLLSKLDSTGQLPNTIYSKKPALHACNSLCMGAHGPDCECRCGGKNHGAGFILSGLLFEGETL